MSLSTISINAQLWTNEAAPIVGDYQAAPGLIEVERSDENEVAVHLRHVDDISALFSGYTDRAGAIALAEALRAAAE